MWCFHGMTIKKDGWMIAILEVTFYYHFLLANTDFVREKWWKVLLLFKGLIIAFLYRKIFSQWLMDLKWLTVWQIFELQVKPFIKVIHKFYILNLFPFKIIVSISRHAKRCGGWHAKKSKGIFSFSFL